MEEKIEWMDEFGTRWSLQCIVPSISTHWQIFLPLGLKILLVLGQHHISFPGAGKGETRNYFIFFFFPTQVNYLLSVLLLCSLNPDLPSFNASKALFNNSCYTFLLCIKSNSLLSVLQMNYDITCSSNVRLQLKHDALYLRGSHWKPVWLWWESTEYTKAAGLSFPLAATVLQSFGEEKSSFFKAKRR